MTYTNTDQYTPANPWQRIVLDDQKMFDAPKTFKCVICRQEFSTQVIGEAFCPDCRTAFNPTEEPASCTNPDHDVPCWCEVLSREENGEKQSRYQM